MAVMIHVKLDRSADIDEAAIGDRTADPADLVLQVGLAKAEALLPGLKAEAENESLGATLLLTGDQGIYEYHCGLYDTHFITT